MESKTEEYPQITEPKQFNIQPNDENKKTFLKVTFFCLGLSLLIGWQSVLATFHFFSTLLSSKVFHYFNIPLQVGQVISAILIHYLAQKFTILQRIGWCLIGVAVILVVLPVIALSFPNMTGLYICTGIIFILGCLTAISQASIISIAGQEGGNINNILWIGNSSCGLLMSSLTILLNIIFMGVDNSITISAFIFFVLGVLVVAVTVVLVKKYAVYRGIDTLEKQQKAILANQDRQDTESKSNEGKSTQTENIKNNQDTISVIAPSQPCSSQLEPEEPKQQKSEQPKTGLQDYIKRLKEAFECAGFIPVFIFLVFLVTFTVFPKMTLFQVQFTSEFLNQNGQLWGNLLLLQTFQIGDVLGNFIGGFQILQKKSIQYTNVLFRFGFIATSLGVAHRSNSILESEWFPFINIFLISLTNGCAVSSLMELGPKSCKGKKHVIETVQFISSFCLVFSILVGSLMAIPFDPEKEIKSYYD